MKIGLRCAKCGSKNVEYETGVYDDSAFFGWCNDCDSETLEEYEVSQ